MPKRPWLGLLSGFGKEAPGALHVKALLAQRLGVPFATRLGEEGAAIDMEGAGQPRNWVGHRMNDVVAKRHGILFRQGLRSGGFNGPAVVGRQATPEDVVFPAGIDADDGPHLV